MATANRKCPKAGNASGLVPVCLLAGGNSAHYCVALTFHLLQQYLLLLLLLFFTSAKELKHKVWIKMLCPKQALKPKVNPKLLI